MRIETIVLAACVAMATSGAIALATAVVRLRQQVQSLRRALWMEENAVQLLHEQVEQVIAEKRRLEDELEHASFN